MTRFIINRRKFLTLAGVAASTVPPRAAMPLTASCRDRARCGSSLHRANGLTYRAHRALIGNDTLVPEFAASEIRQGQRPNGSTDPTDADYLALKDTAFSTYRLTVGGLVEKPVSFSLDELRNMPARTQITRHDCVEGWSCIAKWTGVPLRQILDEAQVKSQARFVVFHCYDTMNLGLQGNVPYYESIDLIDARHPQTILAYGNNDKPLAIANGAPLRVRVERQLGYKMAKYIKGIELVLFAGAVWRRQGRLLGRPRLRLVRRHLTVAFLSSRLGCTRGQIADEIADAGAFQCPERHWTAQVHRGDADARGHQAVDDAFAKARRQFRGEAMAEHLLNQAVSGRNRSGDREMGNDVAHQPQQSQRARPAAIKIGHRPDQPRRSRRSRIRDRRAHAG